MKKIPVAKAILAGLLGLAGSAGAVNLDPNGLGQALVYPYYTVNAHQQTLLSVVNTTDIGKVVKLLFLEAYNGRRVLEFNLYLSAHDVWTANIFALADAGLSSDFAGIFTTDTSCTDPTLRLSGSLDLGGGRTQPYQQFLNFAYTGAANADTGPVTDARTREGHVEMILMSDIAPGSQLDADISHVQPGGLPRNCLNLEADTGLIAPLDANGIADGGLFGSASILDSSQGTFYAYNADAIDGFSYVSLFETPGAGQPTLASVNDRGSPTTATARVLVDGESFTAVFPGPAEGSRRIDAVSALFAADSVYNEYVTSGDDASGTDWVLTFPTKRFYVDAQPGGVIAGADGAFAPFEETFGQNSYSQSCIAISASTLVFNREEGSTGIVTCPFECPPGGASHVICLETNVLSFQSTSVLASNLPLFPVPLADSSGWLKLALSGPTTPALPAATNGNVLHGLPVTGFAATKFVNSFVTRPGGGFALANYTGVYHQRATINCTKSSDPCS